MSTPLSTSTTCDKTGACKAAHDAGLLVLRIAIAVVFVHAGAQKLFGAWGGPGISGFAGFLSAMHYPAPYASAVLATCAEFFGGLLVLLGLATRLATVPMIFTMLVAIYATKGNGFSLMNHGYEFALVCGLMLLALALLGPGAFSVDAAIRASRRTNKTPATTA